MADKTKQGKKRKWKEVSIDNPAFFSGNMEGFVSLEECFDYTLDVNDEGSRVLKVSESTESKKAKKESEQPKKKKKRKKKKSKVSEETVESTGDREPEEGEPAVPQENEQNIVDQGINMILL